MARERNYRRLATGVHQRDNRIYIEWGRGKKEYLDKSYSPTNARDIKSAINLLKQREEESRFGISENNSDDPYLYDFRYAMEEYLEIVDAELKTAPKTRRFLERIWLPHFKGRTLGSIGQFEIKNVIKSWKKKDGGKYSTSEKKNRLIACTQLFKNFDIYPNPCSGIAVPKVQTLPIDRYLPDERTTIISAANRYDYIRPGDFQLTQVLGFACGFRPGEIFGLRKLSFEGELIHADKQVTEDGVQHLKTGKDRWVYIPSWARPYIDKYLKGLEDDEWLFVNHNGGVLKDRTPIYSRHKALHVEMNIPLKREGYAERDMYTNRHTRASELLSTGVSVGDGANQLGHSPEMFQRIYARVMNEFSGKENYSHLEGISLEKNGLRLVE